MVNNDKHSLRTGVVLSQLNKDKQCLRTNKLVTPS